MTHNKRSLCIAMVAMILTFQYSNVVKAQTPTAKDLCDGVFTVSQNILSLSWQATKFFVSHLYDGSCAIYVWGKPHVISGAQSLQAFVVDFYAKYVVNNQKHRSKVVATNTSDVISESEGIVEQPECPICFEQEELFSYCSNSEDHRFCRGCIAEVINHNAHASCSLCRQPFIQDMIDDIQQNQAHRVCVYCQGAATEFETLMPIFLYDTEIVAHNTCHATHAGTQAWSLQ